MDKGKIMLVLIGVGLACLTIITLATSAIASSTSKGIVLAICRLFIIGGLFTMVYFIGIYIRDYSSKEAKP